MSRQMIVPLLIGLLGLVIFGGLCTWQLQRLAWKEGELARIETMIAAPPVALPDVVTEASDEYRPVIVTGTILPEEIHILTSRAQRGAGFRIIAVFQTENGRRILVDRGFVPERMMDTPRPALRGTITGNLQWPDETDGAFTPEPDLKKNIWFARDLPRMAVALGAEPFLVVLNRDPGDGVVEVWPVSTSNIPNNHEEYALTWFLMGLVWLGMTGYWLWRIRRRVD
jgi:surfeit locus 1 family protein